MFEMTSQEISFALEQAYRDYCFTHPYADYCTRTGFDFLSSQAQNESSNFDVEKYLNELYHGRR